MKMDKKKARRRRKLRRAAAWAVFFAVELLAAAIPAAVAAAILVPLAYGWRGYTATGGEWLAIGAIYCAAFAIIHKVMCDKLWEAR